MLCQNILLLLKHFSAIRTSFCYQNIQLISLILFNYWNAWSRCNSGYSSSWRGYSKDQSLKQSLFFKFSFNLVINTLEMSWQTIYDGRSQQSSAFIHVQHQQYLNHLSIAVFAILHKSFFFIHLIEQQIEVSFVRLLIILVKLSLSIEKLIYFQEFSISISS